MEWVLSIAEALILASALSIDAFVASFAYGSNKIKIPMISVQIINLICASITGVALLAGTLLRQCIPEWLTTAVCFAILLILGILKLLDGITKSLIKKFSIPREIKGSIFHIRFILNLYASPQDADIDKSKDISPMEAASLAIALSLDGIAVGFGAALGSTNGWAVFICSLLTGMAAIMLGAWFGNKVAGKINFNLSWISGALLIGMACLKLL